MFDSSDVTLDCQTCLAINTTACNECVVSHLLANDDGPIEFISTLLVRLESPVDRAVAMFSAAGLLDDPHEFVDVADFEAARVPDLSTSSVLR